MNLDIVEIEDGFDLGLAVTDVGKAGNICDVQLGALEYLPDFGVDKRGFLESGLRFPNQSYSAYLVQRMSEYSVNVVSLLESSESLKITMNFGIGESDQSSGGLIL